MNSIDCSRIEQHAAQIVNLALLDFILGERSLEDSRLETIQHYKIYKSSLSEQEKFLLEKIVRRALEMFDDLLETSSTEITNG